MKNDRLYIVIAALVALLAGLQMRRQGCPACVLLPQVPAKNSVPLFDHPTPQP